ncbi:hypothetical protein Pint_04386 [Pistacia integerrima]|uniref:Uncharacterized protein n=1 Tax=Pistacia integerrima TaxID=434235 RepID=A0ACC0Z0J2_9ROSI|nr:hypothetical protein Pint_04386 [Pistacia integerrima]
MELSLAADIINPGQSISDGETLISSFQSFELGFFSPGDSNKRYLGIWYKISPSTVVWVANRNNPLDDKYGNLTVSNEGNLVLLNRDKSIIWSSNSSRVPEHPVVQLLDSGNVVLRESTDTSSSSYMWQSFDYPSDTLLPGMKLGRNLKTGSERHLTSWTSTNDPSSGDFSFRLDISGLPQLAIMMGTRIETRSGPWNGFKFGGIPTMKNSIFIPRFVQNEEELYFTYETFNNTVITRLLMNQSGKVQRLVRNAEGSEWNVMYSWPFDVCDNYAECGANGNCRISKTPICECLKGFVPKPEDEWESTQTRQCVKKLPSDCQSGEGFLKLPRMKLPDIDWSNKSMNLKQCKAACTKNCSCRAYANSELTGGGIGCLIWFKDLTDIRECSKQFDWGQDIFIRVPASELDLDEKKRQETIIVLSIFSGLFILVLIIIITLKKAKKKDEESSKVDSEVPLIELSIIVTATNNFSEKNLIGAGGFGPVYKNTVTDVVAT